MTEDQESYLSWLRTIRNDSKALAMLYDTESKIDDFICFPLWRRLWVAIRPRQHFT
jgi:hypothetical protein